MTLAEDLSPYEKAHLLLREGETVQRVTILRQLPALLAEISKGEMREDRLKKLLLACPCWEHAVDVAEDAAADVLVAAAEGLRDVVEQQLLNGEEQVRQVLPLVLGLLTQVEDRDLMDKALECLTALLPGCPDDVVRDKVRSPWCFFAWVADLFTCRVIR